MRGAQADGVRRRDVAMAWEDVEEMPTGMLYRCTDAGQGERPALPIVSLTFNRLRGQ